MTLLHDIGVALPIVQAPMAGISTPALAAAVCGAGALGSLAVGATDAAGAGAMLADLRRATNRAFNVNVFAHAPAVPDPAREAAWLSALRPSFAACNAEPPAALREIYTSFVADDAMLALLLDARPALVSFHFGLPPPDRIAALKQAGILLLATATSLDEGLAAQRAGMDAVVAQGWEAGGHRGVFAPAAPDARLGVLALTRLLVRGLRTPVIAAGGIMDGAGIAAALALGAAAAQLGTAFVPCPESGADAGYRAALAGPAAAHTVMTAAISGRPARCLSNRFTDLGDTLDVPPPDYPRAYDAGKALHRAASGGGEHGFGAHWAGQGAPLARVMPAARLVATLAREMRQAGGRPIPRYCGGPG
jgi:nitronate monooxygenase